MPLSTINNVVKATYLCTFFHSGAIVDVASSVNFSGISYYMSCTCTVFLPSERVRRTVRLFPWWWCFGGAVCLVVVVVVVPGRLCMRNVARICCSTFRISSLCLNDCRENLIVFTLVKENVCSKNGFIPFPPELAIILHPWPAKYLSDRYLASHASS